MPNLSSVESLLDYAIAPAGPADAEELGRVHVRAWRETYPGLLPQAYLNRMSPKLHARRFHQELMRAKAGQVTLVAESAEGAVGYAHAALLSGEGRSADAEVQTLYVLRSAQRAGVGRGLLSACARVMRAQGAGSLMLFVLTGNEPARRFYERLGGEAFAEVASHGWGEAVTETAYRWADIGVLAS
ncbi:MAG TPA: GNAT family N-acetyltransferase [Caulobacteraceae bacterium]|nr:GNAT family N-acetyltransferase [Caulobacteraceae bacterium]